MKNKLLTLGTIGVVAFGKNNRNVAIGVDNPGAVCLQKVFFFLLPQLSASRQRI
jgi:hypothetical protein